ncbi:MAG: hypothetical protein KKE29_19950 [Proteobacteria bacterium]|nr:hypothetical protein [Pseudomonadota bacterium]MBV1715964.1 hypothetical protein [Desulfarculus sp.]
MLVSIPIPNMINGVSQQAAPLRLPSQGQLQVNCLDSVVEGKGKRPATYHEAKLLTGTLSEVFIHTINRDVNERYKVIITDGDLKVFDLAGNEKTVAFPDGKTYLDVDSPREDFAVVTIADYTFVVNKAKTVAMKDAAVSASPDRGYEAIVWIQQVNYDTDFSITVDGNTASTSIGSAPPIKSTTVASSLQSSLATALGANYTVTQQQSTIWIKRNDGADFNVSIEDSRGNTHMKLIKGQAQRFSDLPTVAPANFVCEVVGDKSSDFDNYYVKFVPNNDSATFDEGVWVETVKPGIEWELDGSTMPYALIRESDGSFSFEQLVWGKREAGDADSAPDPSFVGRTINDIFFFQNRLGLCADENVIMSRAAYFFDFFPSTVTTIVDSDPVDAAASHTKVSILYHAIPWDEKVLFFSDQTQFVLDLDGGILSPKNAPIKPITSFESSTKASPVGAGKNIFFAVSRGEYTSIQEYYVLPDSDTEDAADSTGHVPQYIPKNVFKMAVTDNERVLLALSGDEPSNLYVYRYHWLNTEKVQSSWSYWTFPDASILNADFIESTMYLVLQRTDGVYLERLELSPALKDTGEPIHYHLDRKITEAACASVTYDSVNDETTFNLPYAIDLASDYVVVMRGATTPGRILQTVSKTATSIVVEGDHTNSDVFIGLNYEARFEFSEFTLKETSSSGAKNVVASGRLQLRTITMVYNETGYFEVEVTPLYRDTSTFVFSGRIIGDGSNVLDQIALHSGTRKFALMSKSDQVRVALTNRTFLPCKFVSAEVEAFFHTRSRRS